MFDEARAKRANQYPLGWPARAPASGGKDPCWRIRRENADAMFKFDGELDRYRSWKNRIRDHASEYWPLWRTLLDQSAEAKSEIDWMTLQSMDFGCVTADHLSSDLWSFLLKWVGPNLYLRRTRIGSNIEGNGFELWRRFFTDVEGCCDLVKMAGR